MTTEQDTPPEAQRAPTPEERAQRLKEAWDFNAGELQAIEEALREARDAAYARGKEDGKAGERERCAQLAESAPAYSGVPMMTRSAQAIAAAIRAGGEDDE